MISKSSHRAGLLGIAILAALASGLSAGDANAGGRKVKKIKQCGSISKAGFYELSKNLTKSGSGDCLDINVPLVILDLNGFNLTGGGSGTGIRIMPGATNTFIDASDAKGNSGAISNFAVGLEDDGNDAVVENLGFDMNTDSGLFVNGASGSTFGSFGVAHNTKNGVHLRNATNTVLHNFGPNNNGTYGVWLETSSNSLVDQFLGNNNGVVGVYIGCSASGPVGPTCDGFNSASNVVASAQMDSNSYGVAIDAGSLGNVISDTGQNSNGIDDVFDGNTLCGTNLWFDNTYSNSNEPTCTNE